MMSTTGQTTLAPSGVVQQNHTPTPNGQPSTRPQYTKPIPLKRSNYTGSPDPLQPLTQNAPQNPMSPTSPAPIASSPPTKRDLKSWWKNFKLQPRNHEQQAAPAKEAPGIFGVPLHESIIYANVAISLIDDNGNSYIYGYVPIVVAKCGVYLKEKATEVEGIFRLSGSEKRIKELKLSFDSPDRYGKGLSWAGYTVHDAANVLRRYLNDLPEPVVPLAFYDLFREPLRDQVIPGTSDTDGPQFVETFDVTRAIEQYQQLITQLPPLHRQLLLYILDLLAVFAAKSDFNRMNSQNLAAIFQPGILSHPNHAMAPEEYRLNQTVLIFLIENQDSFLIGMRGTAADEQTKEDVAKGTPPVTPGRQLSDAQPIMGVSRTASNASAGAESVLRDGTIRRNRSTSSRASRHSHRSRHSSSNSPSVSNNHIGSPRSSSPALASTPTSLSKGSSGLSRSNTLPARSPGLSATSRFAKRSDAGASPVSPLTPIHTHTTAQAAPTIEPVQEVETPAEDCNKPDPFTTATPAVRRITPVPGLGLSPATPVSPGSPSAFPPAPALAEGTTPTKEKPRFNLFQRSTSNDTPGELKPTPNKLKKKRMPSSANPSAHSSTASLQPPSNYASPSHEPSTNPLDDQVRRDLAALAVLKANEPKPAEPAPSQLKQSVSAAALEDNMDVTPRASQVPSGATTTSVTPTTSTAADVPAPALGAAPYTPAPAAAEASTATPAPVAPAAPATALSDKPPTPDTKLRPHRNSPSTSLHSSFNEGSEIDQFDDPAVATQHESPDSAVGESPDKKKKRWRLSRRTDDSHQPSPVALAAAVAATQGTAARPSPSSPTNSSPPNQKATLGANGHAGVSTSSVGSGGPSVAGMGSTTLTAASGSDPVLAQANTQASADSAGKDEQGRSKLTGWLKNKYREAKETRNKSPSPTGQSVNSSLNGLVRGKSVDLGRNPDDKPE